jgi:hypothetical protein
VTQTTALEKLKAQFIATLWPLADAYNQSACSEKAAAWCGIMHFAD